MVTRPDVREGKGTTVPDPALSTKDSFSFAAKLLREILTP